MTYSRPLNIKVAFQNRETGEIREQTVFMGDFPWMTDRGTFIINGTERVVVTQLVRSPGAYVMEPKDREKQVFIANLMPARGSWLELEIDKKGRVFVRIDRKRKLPVTVLLRAMGYVSDEKLLEMFDNSVYIRHTIAADTDATRDEEGALIELFKKQRPGEPPSVDAAKTLLDQLFFDTKRYDLTRVGRYKLNARLDLDIDLDTRVLTHDDIIALVKELVSIPKILGIPEEIDEENPIKDYAAEAITYPREPIHDHLDEYEHFGNRRLRTVGELIQEAFRIGLYRMERVVRERLTTEDADAITPQTIINIRPVVAALKEFFGSSQLSQFMDQTNSLAGLTHRRRLSALGAGGLTRERAPIEVRDVHATHYGRMCPIETPEGPNIGLIGSPLLIRAGLRARLRHHPLPRGQGRRRHQRDRPPRRHPGGGEDDRPGQRRGRSRLRQAQGPVRALPPPRGGGGRGAAQAGGPDGRLTDPDLVGGDRPDPLPRARRRQPRADGLQHAAPGRAAAEARAAADRHRHGASRRRVDTGDVTLAENDGEVTLGRRRADHGQPRLQEGRVPAPQVHALQPGHDHPPAPDRRRSGDKVKEGDVLADGSSTSGGEIALGKNCLVAFMSWEGYNFEDAIIISQRLVKDDELTSIHIEEYEIDARTTKLGDEEITRDIPNRSEESPAQPRRARHRPHRRRGRLGRPAGRQGDAEGRDRADRRGEADPRHLQGEGARGPRHLAQGAPRRGRRRHRRAHLQPRRRRRPVAGRQRPGPRLRRHQAQDRRGRQARRPSRQQGRDLQDRPRGGHAVHGGRHAPWT